MPRRPAPTSVRGRTIAQASPARAAAATRASPASLARAWSAHAVWAPRNPAPPVTRWVAIAALLDRLPVLEAPADRAPHAFLELDPRSVAQLALGARDRAGDRLAHLREDVDLLLVAPHRLEERVGDTRQPARQRRKAAAPVRDRHAELVLEQALHRVDDLAHRVGAPVGDPVEVPARRPAPLGQEERLAGVVDVRHRAPRRAAPDQRRLALADHGEEARLPRRLLRAVGPARAEHHG